MCSLTTYTPSVLPRVNMINSYNIGYMQYAFTFAGILYYNPIIFVNNMHANSARSSLRVYSSGLCWDSCPQHIVKCLITNWTITGIMISWLAKSENGWLAVVKVLRLLTNKTIYPQAAWVSSHNWLSLICVITWTNKEYNNSSLHC